MQEDTCFISLSHAKQKNILRLMEYARHGLVNREFRYIGPACHPTSQQPCSLTPSKSLRETIACACTPQARIPQSPIRKIWDQVVGTPPGICLKSLVPNLSDQARAPKSVSKVRSRSSPIKLVPRDLSQKPGPKSFQSNLHSRIGVKNLAPNLSDQAHASVLLFVRKAHSPAAHGPIPKPLAAKDPTPFFPPVFCCKRPYTIFFLQFFVAKAI